MESGFWERATRAVRQTSDRTESIKLTVYQRYPLVGLVANRSFVGCERLGQYVWASWIGPAVILMLGVLFILSSPAAAQVCGTGPMTFLQDIYALVTQGVGTIVVTMVLLAGALKMVPMRGTNSWGNALTGSVIVGIVFLVVAPAVVSLADQSTDSISLTAECTNSTGSSSSGSLSPPSIGGN